MLTQDARNQMLIDAVLEKERQLCPGSIALIGIYGSFLTGDVHPRSDLDLLILINDDRGRQLAEAFIQDDWQVGHDLYCTTWNSLREDARYMHPNIAKLMDSKIVCCADEAYRTELEKLREQVRAMLASPLSAEDYGKAEAQLNMAQPFLVKALTADTLSDMRAMAGGFLYFLENALAMLNKTYFRLGTRRCLEELDALVRKPEKLTDRIEAIAAADSAAALKDAMLLLMKDTQAVFNQTAAQFAAPKRPADRDALSGTYEEIFSNWRNKLTLAAETGDRHLAFMSLTSFASMLEDLAGEVKIGKYDPMAVYDPNDLSASAARFDALLERYLEEYKKVGLQVRRFPDTKAFVKAYLTKDNT